MKTNAAHPAQSLINMSENLGGETIRATVWTEGVRLDLLEASDEQYTVDHEIHSVGEGWRVVLVIS